MADTQNYSPIVPNSEVEQDIFSKNHSKSGGPQLTVAIHFMLVHGLVIYCVLPAIHQSKATTMQKVLMTQSVKQATFH